MTMEDGGAIVESFSRRLLLAMDQVATYTLPVVSYEILGGRTFTFKLNMSSYVTRNCPYLFCFWSLLVHYFCEDHHDSRSNSRPAVPIVSSILSLLHSLRYVTLRCRRKCCIDKAIHVVEMRSQYHRYEVLPLPRHYSLKWPPFGPLEATRLVLQCIFIPYSNRRQVPRYHHHGVVG